MNRFRWCFAQTVTPLPSSTCDLSGKGGCGESTCADSCNAGATINTKAAIARTVNEGSHCRTTLQARDEQASGSFMVDSYSTGGGKTLLGHHTVRSMTARFSQSRRNRRSETAPVRESL